MSGRRLAAGLVILLLGVMFLLTNMGLMDWNAWGLLLRYWPVLLVVAGVSILLGGSFRWFLVLILVLVIVCGTFAGPWVNWTNGPLTTVIFTPDESLAGLTGLIITVSLDAGSVTTTAPASEAFRLELAYRNALRPQYTFTADAGGTGHLTLSQQAMRPGSIGLRQTLSMGFVPGLPLEVIMKGGVLSGNLDLSPYKVRRLDLDAGVASLRIRLGRPEGTVVGNISTGVGTCSLEVPIGIGIRVTGDFGVGVRELTAAGLRRVGGVWQDDQYETASNRIDLHVSGGVGRLSIRRY